ncbi:intracellular protein transport protein USO1-like [Anoplophora glabripennis]|uniref:intracellular protein transport protein USO1-like n=1 Tax=Anoplophora glabripennis TaxID=217634 RepID=UPI000875A240|nr:intracellular protein transport protein USO1-like [Anoplophora glabripennis]
MNFDLDDPLGSDDSFFEEPKALSKLASTKPVEKKSIENVFNLADVKENVDSNRNVETSQKTRSVVTFDESTIKQDEFPKLDTKVRKKTSEDWLGESDSVHDKKTKRTDFLEDLLYGRPTSPKEKKVTSEGTQRSSQSSTQLKSSGPAQDISAPTEVLSNFGLLSNTSRERRRPRKGSSSGLEDALGLFGDGYHSGDSHIKETNPVTSKVATDVQFKPVYTTEKGIPDWLGGSATTSVKSDSGFTKKSEEYVKDKGDVTEGRSSAPEEQDKQNVTPNISEKPKEYDSSLSLKQQQISLDLQNTYSSLQQQETFLLISLQLKKYEENLESIKRQQREILEKQEKRYDSILDKYAVRQQMIENNIRMQQERLNNHVQLLISQPFNDGNKEDSGEGETIKNPYLNKSDMENIMRSLREKHNEELFIMEESYKKQISLIEKSSETLEERLKNEVNYVTNMYEDKINNINKNYNEEISYYKQKISTTEEQNSKNIELIKEHHAKVLEELKEDHVTQIEYLKQFNKRETELLASGQFFSQKLNTSIEMLTDNTKLLQGVQEKINNDSDAISVARQSSIESREKEIILMRNTLEKSREAAENERSQLLALIRSLEMKIAEQNVNAQEDRWALQQASATLVAKSAALEREVEYNRTINEREREQLKTLKTSLLAEQEKIIVQLTEEKLKLSAEKARIETSNKLSNNYESEKIKAEAEMAIQVAKDISQKVSQEREFLFRQKSDIEALKRELNDRERELQDKEINLEYLIENTQRKINDDKKIINEAKKLETKYKERLQELQNQWASLADREKKLAEEKVLLSKERLALYTTIKQTKNCALCKGNDLPIHNGNYYIEDNLPNLKMSDTSGIRFRLDAIEDEKSSEVSKEEN